MNGTAKRRKMFRPSLAAAALVLLVTARLATALSKPYLPSRRHVLAAAWGLCICRDVAHATCLPGDDAVECIGVYKEDLPNTGSDTVRLSYGVFRPDREAIVLSAPTTLVEAMGVLSDQRIALEEVERLVGRAQFTDAGVLLLRVLPKVTLAGRVLVEATQSRDPRMRSMLTTTEQLVRSVDTMMGRAVKGNLASSTTVAQLSVLSEISNTKASLEGLIAAGKSAAPP